MRCLSVATQKLHNGPDLIREGGKTRFFAPKDPVVAAIRAERESLVLPRILKGEVRFAVPRRPQTAEAATGSELPPQPEPSPGSRRSLRPLIACVAIGWALILWVALAWA
jgi:hypothetical protein